MINYIKGILVHKEEQSIIVECNRMGYQIWVPTSIIGDLPSVDNEVKIYTELYVREDIIRLYGFLRSEDLSIFQKLITVSGIGPKAGLGILSYLTPDELRVAVITGNVDKISQAKGIGKKTASKLIIELKDKLGSIELPVQTEEIENADLIGEVQMALNSLGYSAYEINAVLKKIGSIDSIEQAIKKALLYLGNE